MKLHILLATVGLLVSGQYLHAQIPTDSLIKSPIIVQPIEIEDIALHINEFERKRSIGKTFQLVGAGIMTAYYVGVAFPKRNDDDPPSPKWALLGSGMLFVGIVIDSNAGRALWIKNKIKK